MGEFLNIAYEEIAEKVAGKQQSRLNDSEYQCDENHLTPPYVMHRHAGTQRYGEAVCTKRKG